MGFKQYPDDIAVQVLTGGNEMFITSATADELYQLSHMRIQLFKYGAVDPNVIMSVSAYDDTDLIGTSSTIKVEEIPTETDYFYGWFKFTFDPRINLRYTPNTIFKMNFAGYSYSDSAWLGAVLDWPVTMGYNDSPDQIQDAPFALELVGAAND